MAGILGVYGLIVGVILLTRGLNYLYLITVLKLKIQVILINQDINI